MDRAQLEREIGGALRSTIMVYGPISLTTISSATKRIIGALQSQGLVMIPVDEEKVCTPELGCKCKYDHT